MFTKDTRKQDKKILDRLNKQKSNTYISMDFYKEKMLLFGCIISIVIILAFAVIYTHNVYKNAQIEDIRAEYEQQIMALNESIDKLNYRVYTLNKDNYTIYSEYENLYDTYQASLRTNESLVNQFTNLSNEYDSLKETYDSLSKRAELYDKYEYALMYNGKRTELTYDMCQYGEKLMMNYDMDPDLLFSIGMVESKYVENAKNPTSTATGFHQFLKGTGEWVYNKLLGYTDTYVHSEKATNGWLSLEMGACYLNNIYDRTNNVVKTISEYSGLPDPGWYIDRMNKYLAQKNKSVATLDM